jgi:hypothetical protein
VKIEDDDENERYSYVLVERKQSNIHVSVCVACGGAGMAANINACPWTDSWQSIISETTGLSRLNQSTISTFTVAFFVLASDRSKVASSTQRERQ